MESGESVRIHSLALPLSRGADSQMRLDLFLKTSRIVPRRTVAEELCEAGLVSVNDAPAKASKEVKADDVVEIKRRDRITKILVLEVPSTKQVSKKSAGELYRLIEETRLENDPLSSGSH